MQSFGFAFRCGFKMHARNGDGILCDRTVATLVATSVVPEQRCLLAPGTRRTLDQLPASSATAIVCPRPLWRSCTPFTICTLAYPLRSPSLTYLTDDGLRWRRTLTAAFLAILDEELFYASSRIDFEQFDSSIDESIGPRRSLLSINTFRMIAEDGGSGSSLTCILEHPKWFLPTPQLNLEMVTLLLWQYRCSVTPSAK